MTTTAITRSEPQGLSADYSKEKIDLIKQTVAQGASDLELQLFLYTAKRTGLDPLTRQIYAIKRWNSQAQKETMTIQTGIDGYRLIADRTGKLAGIDDAVYDDESADHPNKATVTVRKMIDGQPCAFTASARWQEYCQTKKDGHPTAMWSKMPFLMLGKCAEALALRKAFPADLSGLYTFEEMSQADEGRPEVAAEPEIPVIELSGVIRNQEEDKNSAGREYYRFQIGEATVCAWFDSTVVSRLLDNKGKVATVKVKGDGSVPYELVEVLSIVKPDRAKTEKPKAEPKAKAEPEAAKPVEPSPILDGSNLPNGQKAAYCTIDKFSAMKTKATPQKPSRPYLIVGVKDENDKPFDLFCFDTKVAAGVTKSLHKSCEIAYTSKARGEDTLFNLEGFLSVGGVQTDMYGTPLPTPEHITEADIPEFDGEVA